MTGAAPNFLFLGHPDRCFERKQEHYFPNTEFKRPIILISTDFLPVQNWLRSTPSWGVYLTEINHESESVPHSQTPTQRHYFSLALPNLFTMGVNSSHTSNGSGYIHPSHVLEDLGMIKGQPALKAFFNSSTTITLTLPRQIMLRMLCHHVSFWRAEIPESVSLEASNEAHSSNPHLFSCNLGITVSSKPERLAFFKRWMTHPTYWEFDTWIFILPWGSLFPPQSERCLMTIPSGTFDFVFLCLLQTLPCVVSFVGGEPHLNILAPFVQAQSLPHTWSSTSKKTAQNSFFNLCLQPVRTFWFCLVFGF